MPHDQPVVEVRSADGHCFELIEVVPAQARRQLLLLPGMGISARQYIDFARRLAEAGIAVWIHEWRGNGASSLRAGRGCDWGYDELLRMDLDAARRALAGRGVARLWLAGHSLGAQLACLGAARRPDAVAGLLLIAGGAPYLKVFGARMRLKLALVFRLAPLAAGLFGYFPGKRLGFAGREARGVMRDWARTGRTGSYALPGLDFDADAALAALKLPVKVLRMADDDWVPEASVDWLLGRMPGVRAVRHCVRHAPGMPGADHFGWMRAPGPSARFVAAALEDQNPGP